MGLETPEFNSILAPNHKSHLKASSILHLKEVTFQRKQVKTSRVVQLLHESQNTKFSVDFDVTDICRNVSFSFRLNAPTSVSI